MTKPIVVLSINATWNIVNFRLGLVRGLQDAGFEVVGLSPSDGHEVELKQHGIRHVPIAMKPRGMSPLADTRLLLSYVRVLRRLRPAAYLGFTIKPNVYGGMACRMLRIPRIANIAGLGTAFMQRDGLNLLVRQMYATGLGGAERVFFQNRDDCALFVDGGLVQREQIALLPGSGVDLVRFAPRLRAPDGRTVFLLVTRLLRAKGIAEFVEAAARLRTVHGEAVVCRILGIPDHSPGGVDPATLERWRQEGLVELLEPVSDVRPALADADCVVLPSYYPEGTPRALLEAAAAGKAIITTQTPGCRDVVEDGVNGFLCLPRDPASLTAAMERYRALAPDARQAMSLEGRAKAEREFDETIVVDAYRDVLAQLA